MSTRRSSQKQESSTKRLYFIIYLSSSFPFLSLPFLSFPFPFPTSFSTITKQISSHENFDANHRVVDRYESTLEEHTTLSYAVKVLFVCLFCLFVVFFINQRVTPHTNQRGSLTRIGLHWSSSTCERRVVVVHRISIEEGNPFFCCFCVCLPFFPFPSLPFPSLPFPFPSVFSEQPLFVTRTFS